MADQEHLTTSFGIPVSDNQHSLTAGSSGPTLLEDFHLVEKLAHFNRERIPERIVHAKGAGAHGYFEVTHDVTQWTKAAFLSKVGKRTPAFARFSTVGGEKGSADSARDPRGFALKFYTEEGNYDLVGNNTPVFFIRDAIKFPDFIHTQKRNPQTNAKDANMFWDFLSLTPESVHQVTILFSDRGTPKTYRNMDGFGSHTFKWVNAEGKGVWIKYHFKTEAGIENWTDEEATKMAGENPDYATIDLFEHIASGKEAAWTVSVQIMPLEDAATYRFDPFDVTKVWPHKDYPLIPFGRLVLNRNPQNYFAEVEQSAFSPANVVPGVEFSPDKMLQGRIFAYPDTHRYRLGANYSLLPINRPVFEPRNYQRDGAMRFDANGAGSPNYEPNSFNGPASAPLYSASPLEVSGVTVRTGYRDQDSDFVQAGNLYRLMTEEAKSRLVSNLVGHMKAARKDIQERQVMHFYHADADYGTRVAKGLGIEIKVPITGD
ncbi:MAG TPA: catalase [Ktedonobacteraceae bacterium]|jgi:catalase